MLNVGMGDDCLVDCLKCPVSSLLMVIGRGCEAEDYQPICCRVRLWEDHFLPGLLLTPGLHEFNRLLLCYLHVGWCRGRDGLLGGGWFWALLGWCRRGPGGYWNGCGGETYR